LAARALRALAVVEEQEVLALLRQPPEASEPRMAVVPARSVFQRSDSLFRQPLSCLFVLPREGYKIEERS